MMRQGSENLPIASLGLRQPAGLVVCETCSQQLGRIGSISACHVFAR